MKQGAAQKKNFKIIVVEEIVSKYSTWLIIHTVVVNNVEKNYSYWNRSRIFIFLVPN
jgi:hypothetical protein